MGVNLELNLGKYIHLIKNAYNFASAYTVNKDLTILDRK